MAYQVRNINPLDLKPSIGIGVSIPFSTKSVFTTVYTTQEQLKYNIINYLLTGRKERVFNPNFGAGLRDLLFENITSRNIQDTELSIRSGLEINFPNINVSELFIKPEPDNNTIVINFSYIIINTGIEDEININFQNG
jgi:phage baseplate assembly protein W